MASLPGAEDFAAARPAAGLSAPDHRRWACPPLSRIALSPDDLVNSGRMVSTVFGLLAIWLDPTRPSRELGTVQMILGVYLSLSLLMLVSARFRRDRSERSRWITHTIDIGALSLLVLYSEELDSPFFVFFSFTLITAALQWGMGGIFATALALQMLLGGSALFDLQDGDSEANIFVMRSAFCWVSAVMLGYFATYREQMRRRLARLAAWQPEGSLVGQDDAFSRSLDGALEILGASHVILLWKNPDLPSGHAVLRAWGLSSVGTVDADAIDSFRELRETLIARPRQALTPELLDLFRGLSPTTLDIRRIARWETVCITRLASRRHQGVVIVIDGSGEKEQLAALADIVTLRIAAHLEQLASAGEQVEAAGLREREGLARDLHDGVLQHLTAAAIHLKVARVTPAAQSDRLATVAEILLDQQQQIRHFIEGARTCAKPQNQPLEWQLHRLARTLAQRWDCAINLNVTPRSLQIDSALAPELFLLLSEAAANAVRHGKARRIDWTVSCEGAMLTLDITDDGCGLSGAHAEAFPRSLSARVAMLGGTMDIVSRAAGPKSGLQLGIRIGMEAAA